MKQLKYAIQNVIRGKGSNIVKVVSITLGLLVSVILIAKVAYELSYDNFYRDNEQLYVVKTGWDGGKPLHGNNIYPTAAAIARHFSAQVKNETHVQYRLHASYIYVRPVCQAPRRSGCGNVQNDIDSF